MDGGWGGGWGERDVDYKPQLKCTLAQKGKEGDTDRERETGRH